MSLRTIPLLPTLHDLEEALTFPAWLPSVMGRVPAGTPVITYPQMPLAVDLPFSVSLFSRAARERWLTRRQLLARVPSDLVVHGPVLSDSCCSPGIWYGASGRRSAAEDAAEPLGQPTKPAPSGGTGLRSAGDELIEMRRDRGGEAPLEEVQHRVRRLRGLLGREAGALSDLSDELVHDEFSVND
jgi:hypothetical protein